MKFLVILICLAANYLWRKDLDRIDDAWFYFLQNKLKLAVSSRTETYPRAWIAGLLILLILPLLVLLLVLTLLEGLFFGLATMAVHVLILLMAFDRTHPGLIVQEYLDHWREGDFEACIHYLENELDCEFLPEPGDVGALHQAVSRLYLYRCFEKMFVMFFWYVLTGPMGVLFAYLCYQLRDSNRGAELGNSRAIVQRIIILIEWLPLRLLAITLCLVGDFENCFNRLRQTPLIDEADASETIHGLATCALADKNFTDANVKGDAVQTDSPSFRLRAEQEIHAFRGLLERSQVVWLCFIALFTIFGMQI